MTLGELYRQGRRTLAGAGNEAAAFDADCLFQKVFGLDRQERILRSAEPADGQKAEEYQEDIASRAGGRPLQYILGEWPFLDLTLRVGEGVLIPREETELLVRTAAGLLRGAPTPRVLDLCSGSGAVALGLASLLPVARVAAVEFYVEAYAYLTENIRRTGLQNVEPVRLDVLDAQSARRFSGLDGVVSNPPYVRTCELPGLQREVRREPPAALDGGGDGLLFYRAIAETWLPRLKPGGIVAVEVGEGQAEDVSALFRAAGVSQICVEADFNGIGRVVSGVR